MDLEIFVQVPEHEGNLGKDPKGEEEDAEEEDDDHGGRIVWSSGDCKREWWCLMKVYFD